MPINGLRIAIVGFGPRGLGALEALVRRALQQGASVAVDIFDPGDWPAAGPNFSPDEDPLCQLNLPLRSIDLPPPVLGTFGDFAQSLKGRFGPEIFPPRAALGTYLNERFAALLSELPAQIVVQTHQLHITNAVWRGAAWTLRANPQDFGPYDHVLLTLGQPETRPDEQVQRWRKHADAHDLTLTDAYPGAALVQSAEAWAGRNVAIRGLGLSALDVIRLLTLGLGGRVVDGRYHPSGREPSRIIPFSLDGHAPAPKPATKEFDARFDLTPVEDTEFAQTLEAALDGPAKDALSRICKVMAGPALRILRDIGTGANDQAIGKWL
ncbi:MAG: FAD/NAD(P)-binding protein, partial [Deltaproteobacteria bacterium]